MAVQPYVDRYQQGGAGGFSFGGAALGAGTMFLAGGGGKLGTATGVALGGFGGMELAAGLAAWTAGAAATHIGGRGLRIPFSGRMAGGPKYIARGAGYGEFEKAFVAQSQYGKRAAKQPGMLREMVSGRTRSRAEQAFIKERLKIGLESKLGQRVAPTATKLFGKRAGTALASRIGGGLAGIGSLAGTAFAAYTIYTMGRLAFDLGGMAAQALAERGRQLKQTRYGNQFYGIETAATMRRSAMMAIGNSSMSGRALIGNEAALMHG